MSCTDDDLKRLKEELKRPREVHHLDSWAPEIEALLARLEAAEKAVEYAEGCDKGEIDSCEMRLAFKAWRKTAGKL